MTSRKCYETVSMVILLSSNFYSNWVLELEMVNVQGNFEIQSSPVRSPSVAPAISLKLFTRYGPLTNQDMQPPAISVP